MTAPSIISDAHAREIADWWAADHGVFAALAARGEIRSDALAIIDGMLAQGLPSVDEGELEKLRAYVAHHGERGPVDSWSEL